MNQRVHQNDNDEIRPEYDFSQGVRGKHYEAYRVGTNVVLLEPDMAKVSTDSPSVNRVLRLLLQLAKTNVPVETRPNRTPRPTSRAQRRATKAKPVRAARG